MLEGIRYQNNPLTVDLLEDLLKRQVDGYSNEAKEVI
jgi:hypothetical protein